MMTTTMAEEVNNDDYINQTVGIIIPPPEIESIVDKTAEFIAKSGVEFEQKLLQGNDPKFNFLRSEHPYNAYYRKKIEDIFNAVEQEMDFIENEEIEVDQELKPAAVPTESTTIVSKKADVIVSRREKPKSDPLKYMFDVPIPPTLTVQEYDIIKLTAQYAAANGKQFLDAITQRESRNPKFDFLNPKNDHFQFFMQISAVYSRIINPDIPLDFNPQQQQQDGKRKTIIDHLKFFAETANMSQILDTIYAKAEWETMQEEERRRKLLDEESERLAISAIDWHDFVIVETIDFDEEEEDEEEEAAWQQQQQEMEEEEGEVTVRLEQHRISPSTTEIQMHEREMAIDTEIEDKAKMKETKPPLVLMEDEEELAKRIRKNYVKKDKTKVAPTYDPTKYFKDQTTGELIPIDQAEKHMRIKTLDPRWKEQKEREMEKFKTTNIAPDVEIADQLMNMVKKKAGEKEGNVPAKPVVTWDGHKTSAAFVAVQAAALGASKPEPQAPTSNLPVYGPAVPPPPAPKYDVQNAPPPMFQQQGAQIPGYPITGNFIPLQQPFPPTFGLPPQPPGFITPPGFAPPPPPSAKAATTGPRPEPEQPQAKRQKGEDGQ